VDADEVTYPLHIILRFDLERALFDGTITVNDLPSIWNLKMKELLGVIVPDNSSGVLQDVHWGSGAFGYFPSYTTGAMMAAQLFETIKKEMPDINQQIAKGEFSLIKEWLRTNIHEVGSLYASPDELLIAVTGKPLDPEIYINYLCEKYNRLYLSS
jgi:carboxypeptidase Taq